MSTSHEAQVASPWHQVPSRVSSQFSQVHVKSQVPDTKSQVESQVNSVKSMSSRKSQNYATRLESPSLEMRRHHTSHNSNDASEYVTSTVSWFAVYCISVM